MRAKLSAQIDTGATWSTSTSAPAATKSPAMVSINGSPAATKLPKATTRMASVICDEEPGHGEHQRKSGGHQAAEGDDEDGERDRPRQHLRPHHRRAVGRVEVRPERAVTGERDAHVAVAEAGQRAGERVGRGHHLIGA